MGGSYRGESGFPQDIAHSHRIAEYLRATFEAVDEGVTIFDSDLRLVTWNHRLIEMETGIAPQFLRYGASLEELYIESAKLGLFGEGDPEEIARYHIQAIRNGPLIPTEILRPKSGRSIRINRFRLPDGGVCATFRDLTEELRLEADLRQSQKLEAIGKLTGGLAHDLNNLLTVIVGNVELLALKAEDETAEGLDAIMQSATRASDLTHRLLAFARKQPLAPKATQVGPLLNSFADLLQKAAGENVLVEVLSDSETWSCLVDRSQLETTVLNLVVNARDSITDGGSIRVVTSNAELSFEAAHKLDLEPGHYVCISVDDTGRGMTVEHLERAIEPFFTTKPPGQGTGLGLSMAHGFAKQSGGGIMIDSAPGQGTGVKLYFPRHEARVEWEKPVPQPATAHRDLLEGKTVLLVEDDDSVRSVVAQQLRRLGTSTVIVASQASEALELARGIRVDLLVTDLFLKNGPGGLDLARALRNTHPAIPILFMSGYSEEVLALQKSEPFGTKLLSKPFRISDLSSAIRGALESA